MAKKIKKEVEPLTKQTLAEMVQTYFDHGGTVKKCPERYATGAYRGTLIAPNKKK